MWCPSSPCPRDRPCWWQRGSCVRYRTPTQIQRITRTLFGPSGPFSPRWLASGSSGGTSVAHARRHLCWACQWLTPWVLLLLLLLLLLAITAEASWPGSAAWLPPRRTLSTQTLRQPEPLQSRVGWTSGAGIPGTESKRCSGLRSNCHHRPHHRRRCRCRFGTDTRVGGVPPITPTPTPTTTTTKTTANSTNQSSNASRFTASPGTFCTTFPRVPSGSP
mmetsp:Transcript_19129/g.53251  ORF Transcript_19129/g.53251 Transcript_19129/m.53251 type:complete len:219 (-) Transcript_19129:310-966(-)